MLVLVTLASLVIAMAWERAWVFVGQGLLLVAIIAVVATSLVFLAFVVPVAAVTSVVAVTATVVTASQLIAIVRVRSAIVESALIIHVFNESQQLGGGQLLV